MWFAVAFIIIIIILLLYMDIRKPHNYPPGPNWLPVLGSALAVNKLRTETGYLSKACNKLVEMFCPRGVLGLRVGKDQIVVVNGWEAIKEMLLNEDIDGRPKGPFYETRTWGKRRGIILTDEDVWKDQRRFIVRHLKEFGFGRRGMVEMVQSEAEQLLADMKAKVYGSNNNNGAVIQMHDAFATYVLNTLWCMMAGIRYSPEDAELCLLQELLFELFASIDMVGATFSHFPILRYIAPNLSGYTSFVRTHSQIWTFLRAELDKHKNAFKLENEDRDFMDAYIRMLKSADKKPSFSDEQLLAICMDMFMAGTETTSKSLGFAFLYLVREPEIQKKAQREIDMVIGRERSPTLDDRMNMPYNEAVVLETVRMFMGRTFGIPHRALRDTKLRGYTIPKDAMVIANFNALLMSEELFKDAEQFRPERFLSNGKICIPDSYVPFGIGKHRCMGESLARSNVFMFTVTMLQNFDFLVPPGQKPPTVDAIDGATPSAAPYEALVVPRMRFHTHNT